MQCILKMYVYLRLGSYWSKILQCSTSSASSFDQKETSKGKSWISFYISSWLTICTYQNRRLLIIGTTTEHKVLDDMDIADAFDTKIYVSTLTSLAAVETVLKVSHMLW